MNRLLKILLLFVSVIILIYVIPPSPSFPTPPTDSEQSTEPADSESPLRRAYFTNLNREEVVNHYRLQFYNKVGMPTLRLNYPPEESQSIIRDQTKSTYLEELVHPLRESIYINGFEPKSEKDTIVINGRKWQQKIIIRYIPSSVIIRLVISCLTIVLSYLLMREYTHAKQS